MRINGSFRVPGLTAQQVFLQIIRDGTFVEGNPLDGPLDGIAFSEQGPSSPNDIP